LIAAITITVASEAAKQRQDSNLRPPGYEPNGKGAVTLAALGLLIIVSTVGSMIWSFRTKAKGN
jgi:hypothetical protein